jgi:transposase
MAPPTESLPDDLASLKAMLLAERAQNERLRQIIKELQRHRFGRRAESLPEDQMLLALEDVELTEAAVATNAEDQIQVGSATPRRRRMNRGSLPPHLPRIETIVDIDDKT